MNFNTGDRQGAKERKRHECASLCGRGGLSRGEPFALKARAVTPSDADGNLDGLCTSHHHKPSRGGPAIRHGRRNAASVSWKAGRVDRG